MTCNLLTLNSWNVIDLQTRRKKFYCLDNDNIITLFYKLIDFTEMYLTAIGPLFLY